MGKAETVNLTINITSSFNHTAPTHDAATSTVNANKPSISDTNDTIFNKLGIDSYNGGDGIHDRLDFSGYQLPNNFNDSQLPERTPEDTRFLSSVLKDVSLKPHAVLNLKDNHIEALDTQDNGSYRWVKKDISKIENIHSGKTNDLIIGNEVSNHLSSGDGRDFIASGGGNDWLNSGKGDDHLYGEVGNDHLYGEAGNDDLDGGGDDDYLYGGEGNDRLYGKAGKDTLHGGKGDDQLEGGKGDDTLFGGNGRDTFVFYRDYGINVIKDFKVGEDSLQIHNNQYYDNFEDLRDFLSQDGNNVVYTFDENNKIIIENVQLSQLINLTLNFRNDPLPASSQNQVPLRSGNYNAHVTFNLEEGYVESKYHNHDGSPEWIRETITNIENINSGQTDDAIIGNKANNVFFTNEGDDVAYGRQGDDEIHGGQGRDWLYGNEGDDILYGDKGDDTLYGNEGDDTLFGGDGKDTLHGGKGDDEFYGGNGNDEIRGNNGNDKLYGDQGNDRLFGDQGNDILLGDKGDDVLFGNNGDDILRGGEGDDQLFGGSGDDRLDGGQGNDRLSGGSGDDWLQGGGGDDKLYGGKGYDQLEGEKGNDWLDGGKGDDKLFGGLGRDTFVFRKGDGRDTIGDFTDGEDIILIDGKKYNNFNDLESVISQNGHDIVIDFGEGDQVIIENIDRSQLSADDFNFA